MFSSTGSTFHAEKKTHTTIQTTPKGRQISNDSQQNDIFFEIDENLAKAAKLPLRLLLPDKQLVLMCDASEQTACYIHPTGD